MPSIVIVCRPWTLVGTGTVAATACPSTPPARPGVSDIGGAVADGATTAAGDGDGWTNCAAAGGVTVPSWSWSSVCASFSFSW